MTESSWWERESWSFLWENTWVWLLLNLMAFFVVYMYLWKGIVLGVWDGGVLTEERDGRFEGFASIEKFTTKFGPDVYDDFYGEVYDDIHLGHERAAHEVVSILTHTSADPNHSVILDVGPGTGHTLAALAKAGYRQIYGRDQSAAMVKQCQMRLREDSAVAHQVKQGDVCEPMLYDRNSFTHILCLYYTLYEIADQRAFFRNCYYWLQSGGQLVVHVVDPTEFDTIVPAGHLDALPETQQHVRAANQKRIDKTIIDFGPYKYTGKYVMGKNKTKNGEGGGNEDVPIKFEEMFVDAATKNVRQHERALYMPSRAEVEQMASRAGFSLHGLVKVAEETETGLKDKCFGDEHQFLLIFIK